MSIHAKSGGMLEVMGMLMGKIVDSTFHVLNVFPLPVEGTETRVNAQSQANEYIIKYLETQRSNGVSDYCIGWYHSHPGYGCWLSGIDVGTQALNQQFQDPFLAVVIDPHETIKTGKVAIGGFRTYPEGHKVRIASRRRLVIVSSSSHRRLVGNLTRSSPFPSVRRSLLRAAPMRGPRRAPSHWRRSRTLVSTPIATMRSSRRSSRRRRTSLPWTSSARIDGPTSSVAGRRSAQRRRISSSRRSNSFRKRCFTLSRRGPSRSRGRTW